MLIKSSYIDSQLLCILGILDFCTSILLFLFHHDFLNCFLVFLLVYRDDVILEIVQGIVFWKCSFRVFAQSEHECIPVFKMAFSSFTTSPSLFSISCNNVVIQSFTTNFLSMCTDLFFPRQTSRPPAPALDHVVSVTGRIVEREDICQILVAELHIRWKSIFSQLEMKIEFDQILFCHNFFKWNKRKWVLGRITRL